MASNESKRIKAALMENRRMLGKNREIDFTQERKSIESQYSGMPLPDCCTFRRGEFCGVDTEWIMVENAPADKAILYIHGGGFTCFSIDSTRFLAAAIAKASGMNAISIGYRLAPEHPYPAANDDCLAVYRGLLELGMPPQRMVVTGESAGGMLSLAAVLALKASGEPLPAAVAVMSPLTDMLLTGASLHQKEEADPVLTPGEIRKTLIAFASGENLGNPCLSPLYGDYSGFPPLLVQVGTDEILLSDSIRLAEKAGMAGVEVTLKIWDGMFHGFHSFIGQFPEADEAIGNMAGFFRRMTNA